MDFIKRELIQFFDRMMELVRKECQIQARLDGCIRSFVEKVYNTLKEHGYNLDITPIVFVGGGATVMKLFGNVKGSNIQYIEDVRANAKGYEYLGKAFLAGNRKAVEAGVR